MSLSRLEKDAVVAEEARVAKLREKARADTADERKLRKKTMEEEREHTRYCVNGARLAAAARACSGSGASLQAKKRARHARRACVRGRRGR